MMTSRIKNGGFFVPSFAANIAENPVLTKLSSDKAAVTCTHYIYRNS